MKTIVKVCCPNCGSRAERHYIKPSSIVQTQCSTCDYLMVSCARTGRVVEAYAPGIAMR
ncbi:replication restart DNA helicase PriA [Oscillatoria sp. FACHB-1406]|uniref:replication restart DNA helicase PriA n=1 Tax=Oscillatoria sp. FACHB-1406 TaxID=2692846 RepID=UPI001688E6ED|nr:replication restart DNA helicase PriA [Oscillatoria sp. FACHB-1406]MBD2579419.1 replication restart DNA helicase PriA [Oscillatoria sp. FACHB-1406]